MKKNIIGVINKYNPKVIIFDIDGTLKDLCKEHSNALRITLEQFNVTNFKMKFVLVINMIAMFIVKTGLIPTNHSKQNLLVKFFAVISGISIVDFYDKYFENYGKQCCLFAGVDNLLAYLNNSKTVYFATTNSQNYNLEEYGIPQKRIMYTEGSFKLATYNRILRRTNVKHEEVLVIGDNLFDDWFSAKRLGVKCLLVNQYNNKLKKIICKLVNGRHLE